jgi:hypothetical protein
MDLLFLLVVTQYSWDRWGIQCFSKAAQKIRVEVSKLLSHLRANFLTSEAVLDLGSGGPETAEQRK